MGTYYTPEQRRAYRLVYQAKQSGRLVPAASCELCGNSQQQIRAHHWRGYEYPLDVWWICSRCNALVPEHDGSLSKDKARQRVVKVVATPALVQRRRRTTGDHINVADGTWEHIISILVDAFKIDAGIPYNIANRVMADNAEWQSLSENKQRVLVRAALRR